MNEQMIDDELQHKLAEAIDNVIWPLADWDGDRLNASSAAGKAARAAHSVMAAKIAELEEALDMLCDSVEREDEMNGSISGALMADMREARAALAPYPEGTDQP